jgi:hypothetical protein
MRICRQIRVIAVVQQVFQQEAGAEYIDPHGRRRDPVGTAS